jgi:hypothetical protein
VIVLVALSGFVVYVGYHKQATSTTTQIRYALTFNQISPCPKGTSNYNTILIPWYATLSNGINSTSKVQPTNSSVREANGHAANGLGGYPANTPYAMITFYLPSGQYNYTIGPPNYFSVNQTSSSGTVGINGGNATVDFNPVIEHESCGATITTTTATSTTNG